MCGDPARGGKGPAGPHPAPAGPPFPRGDTHEHISPAVVGLDEPEPLGARQPADGPRQAAPGRAKIYRLLAARAHEALRARSSVVADGTFQEDTARAAIEGAAHDVDVMAVWLEAPAQTRIVRVARRRGDVSDATPEIALQQVEPANLGDNWLRVDASGATDTMARVRQLLANRLDPGRGDDNRFTHGAA